MILLYCFNQLKSITPGGHRGEIAEKNFRRFVQKYKKFLSSGFVFSLRAKDSPLPESSVSCYNNNNLTA